MARFSVADIKLDYLKIKPKPIPNQPTNPTPTKEKQPRPKQQNKMNEKSHKNPTTPKLRAQVIDYNFEN